MTNQAAGRADAISIRQYARQVGEEIGVSAWFEITQDRVNAFAECTEDRQFIHVDPDAARKTSFGGTIAHGYLTLSLLSYLMTHMGQPEIDGLAMGINYGSDRVRYLAPVRVGTRIRVRATLLEVLEKNPGQWLVRTAVTVEIENEPTPALVADVLSLLVIREN